MSENGSKPSRDQVLEEIRSADRFILVTHENPDGDALGSLVAMQEILRALDKDSVMFMAAEEFPLPYEYRFFVLDGLVSVVPDDVAKRTIVFLDCGNIDRNPAHELKRDGSHILNLDHHHDNTRFGTVNHVVPEASCTAEVVWDLMKALGVRPTLPVAEALYVGLVTDTGKFMYENTDARSHRMAAGLIEAGVEVNDVYRRLYEHAPIEKLKLLAQALGKIEILDDGRLAVTYISTDDYGATGASEGLTEGVIDHLRTIDGTLAAAVVRDQAESGRAARKVSMRSTDGRVDVSAIARVHGGGGHRRAAGFGTDLSYEQVVEFLIAEIDSQLES